MQSLLTRVVGLAKDYMYGMYSLMPLSGLGLESGTCGEVTKQPHPFSGYFGSPMRISRNLRWKIVHTFERLQRIRAVAKELGVSRATVWRWVKRHSATDEVSDASGRGRKAVLTQDLAEKATPMLKSSEFPAAMAVSRSLEADGLTPRVLSKSTITRAVHKNALAQGIRLRYFRGRPRKKLSVANQGQRLAFALQHQRQRWLNVLFTDRKNFWAWVEGQVNSLGCKTFEDYKKQLLNTISQVPNPMLARLVDSVHGRLAKVRELGGKKTRY